MTCRACGSTNCLEDENGYCHVCYLSLAERLLRKYNMSFAMPLAKTAGIVARLITLEGLGGK